MLILSQRIEAMSLKSEEGHMRKSDTMLIELNTKFNDFMENYKVAEKEKSDWRDKFENRMVNIEDNLRTLSIPFKITIWLFTISGGAFLVESIKRLIEYLKIHIHFH